MLIEKTGRTEFSKLQNLPFHQQTIQTQRTTRSKNKIKNLQKKVILKFQDTNKMLKKNHETKNKFKNITRQLRRTTNNLNIRKFKKNNPSAQLKKFEKHSNSSIFLFDEQIQKSQKNFDQFLQKKRKQNFYLKNKMKIFGNTISDHEKILLQNDIKHETNKLLSVQRHNMKESSSQRYKGIEKQGKYIISHMILQKFLQVIAQNPEHLQLKEEFSAIYKKIKQQMISIILDEDKIYKKLMNFEDYIESSKESKFGFGTKGLLQLTKTRKPFYLRKQRKKDQGVQQIQKLLEASKNFIYNSLVKFNRPKIAQQFLQSWNSN